MKRKTRDSLLLDVLRLMRRLDDGQKRFMLLLVGETLIVDYKNVKRKDIEKKIQENTPI